MINPRTQDDEFRRFKSIIENVVRPTDLGLEIGPFDRPIFTEDEATVEYIDYRSTEEARAFAAVAPGHNPEFVPNINYVVPSSGDWDFVPNERFDWILSSHALEHSTSLIDIMLMIASKLKTGGLLITCLPDKRRMFDVYRPITTLGALLEDHIRGAKTCRPQAVFDQLFYGRTMSISASEATYVENRDVLLSDGDFARAFREAKLAAHGYVDAHNYVFTSESYEAIFDVLCKNQIIPFLPVMHIHPETIEMSFMSILRKHELC